jgi:hypothetical protein
MESKLCEEQFKNFGEEIEKYEKLYQQMKDWKSGIESEMEKKDAEIARLMGLAKQVQNELGETNSSPNLYDVYPEQSNVNEIENQLKRNTQDNQDPDTFDFGNIYRSDDEQERENPMLTPDENRSEKSDEEILYEQPLIGSEDIKRADGTKIIERVSNVDTYSALLSAVLNDINYRDDKHIQNLIKRMRKYKFSKNIDHDTDASHKQLSESFLRNMKNVGKNPNNYGVGRILNIDKPNPNPNLNPKPQQQQQQSRRLPATQMSRRRGGKSKKFKRTRKKY